MGGIKSILQLIQFADYIDNIHSVCVQYRMRGCLDDMKMKTLHEIYSVLVSEKGKTELNALSSKKYLAEIRNILDLMDENRHALGVFAVAKESADFYQFLQEKNFRGTEGASFFMQQHTLITSHLQHEEYNEQVLNHLLVAFRYMSPFLDTQQDLSHLMREVYRSCGQQSIKGGHTDFVQLHTVNKNIHLVRLWFSRAEGDTLENVAEDLKSLLKTGCFEFILPEYMDESKSAVPVWWKEGDQSRLLLHYQPSAPTHGPELARSVAPARLVTWNREQIEDFTRKLGFLEKGSEVGIHFKFQRLSTIAQRVFAAQCELVNLGCPQAILKEMDCSDLEKAERLVNSLEERLFEWRQKLKQLRTDYDKLLFFHIPKLLRMFKILCHGSSVLDNVPQIVQEVSFLFESTVEAREYIRATLQHVLDKPQDVQSEKTELPIAQLGMILDVLFQDEKVANRAFPKRKAPTQVKTLTQQREAPTLYPASWKHHCVMHVVPGQMPQVLIRLIFEVYKGIPAPYEVYRCRASSTEEELSLFFHRILKFPSLRFSILDVNKLPLKLQEVLLQLHLSLEKEEPCCTIHYIATGPCVLEDMPWVTVQEHKPSLLKDDWKQTCAECEPLLNPSNTTFAAFELVCGRAGDGKTHYIREKLKSSGGEQLTIAINESFSPVSVIKQLRNLPEKSQNILYLSLTLLPPCEESSEEDRQLYHSVMSEVQWFLLDLFFLGYVEDPSSGLSFKMPSELNWACYFEVPSHEGVEPLTSLPGFFQQLPVLELVGKIKHIHSDHPLDVDSDVQLVCKYLNAYHQKDDPIHGINRLYELPHFSLIPRLEQKTPVRFEHLPDLPVDLCHRLLTRYMPKEVTMSKMYQKLFIAYMKRRCKFLEGFPGLNYNAGKAPFGHSFGSPAMVDTTRLGSTIMDTMLKEVGEFCSPEKRNNWSDATRQQLVYDVQDGGGCFHLIAVNAENMTQEEVEKYQIMGVDLPPTHELATMKYLHKYLASALNLSLENKRLKILDDRQYVLTLDYTLKMLEIHERFECGIPVIIEGETGVGKTALVEMLSILWNQSLLGDWRLLRTRVFDLLERMHGMIKVEDDVKASCSQLMQSIKESTPVQLEDLEKVCSPSQDVITPEGSTENQNVHELLTSYVQQVITSPVITLLDFEMVWEERQLVETDDDQSYPDCDFSAMMEGFKAATHRSQATAGLLFYLLRARPILTFHKLNVHAALTPKDFSDFLQPIFDQGSDLQSKWAAAGSTVPKVTVFLDEINTSSCMGLLKEVLVDRTFFGQPVPDNIFIVAACNPHRGNSVILLEKNLPSKAWVRGSYNVHRLHPTIRYLKWDYGALDSQQEEQYIKAKMEMIEHDSNLTDTDRSHIGHLSIMIVQSQELMRRFATDHLKETCGYPFDLAAKLAHSCVSQRDIQRVFTFYQWLYHGYRKYLTSYWKEQFSAEDVANPCRLQERALMVALGIVYYLRLDEIFRDRYQNELKTVTMESLTVKEVLEDELKVYSKHLSIPNGIAKTQALLENLFCIIACCCTKTPLIIVGAPGSSKTLSFNLALANIKGAESKSDLFRDNEIFPSMDPHFYQCSRRTTSVEVETVFMRAIKRQAGFKELRIPINCVVFMDEAGLPEESHESLKVLHKYLENREVSFVAISNHLLDAAKTNRAASLFRDSYNFADMQTLARECLGSAAQEDANAMTVEKLCVPYRFWMNNHKWFKDFFGLRDFIHMIHYLRCEKTGSITPQVVMAALERNFNGCEAFNNICKEFLQHLKSSPEQVRQRSVIEILQESLQDKPNRSVHGNQETYNEVRYKLLIDPSEDDSLSRLLLMYHILDPEKTKTFMCSDFPEDNQLQKINTIAAIRHAAVEGQTVLMSQTDDIHESFYDLFNQHFRRIDNPDITKEPRFYANIAIGSYHKPCRVHKDFQCVVIVKKSKLFNTPAPFLNRFEKYCISHKNFLDARFRSLQPCLHVVMECVLEKVHEFFSFVGESSFYGAQNGESIESLALSILPSPGFKFTELRQDVRSTTMQLAEAMVEEKEAEDGPVILLTALINTLQEDAGFHFIKLSNAEVQEDAAHILGQLSSLPSDFRGVAQAILENRHSREQLISYVHDAVNHLHLAPSPEACKTEYGYLHLKEISEDSCVVVMVMVQWLVLYMSKRLLQLMTAEALTLSRKWIPHWCLNSYLTHQSHFSLKELIANNMQQALLNSSSSFGMVPTKLMCFTRSTPNIHRLPAVYPTLLSSTDHGLSREALMRDMITDELAPLYLCKLSSILSEQAFRNHLQSFTQSKEKRIMLLVINMQETSKQMVNHIRIMIEQAECSVRDSQKLFVLLLHFPPSMFYNPCYPALFLNGWDHHYLDSVQPEPGGTVDIRLWFSMACQEGQHSDRQDVIVKAVQSMIPDSVSILSSRVSIGSKNGGLFNSTPTDGKDRMRRFEQLLTGPVGDKLCQMYARYWQPAGMAHYLEEAALYSKDHKSTVSITDSVRDFFQTAFHNFLAYMVNLINQDFNIDIIFAEDCEEATLDLFVQLMELLPNLPTLAEVKAYNNTWTTEQECITTPSFPFFHWVAKAMDELLERSLEEMQRLTKPIMEASIGVPSSGTSYTKELITTLERQLVATLENNENPLLKAAITAIGKDDSLWQRYWKDLMANRFHLNTGEDSLAFEKISHQLANTLSSAIPVVRKMALLHSATHANQINLAKLVASLRPLQMLQKIMERILVPTLSPDSLNMMFLSIVGQSLDHVHDPVALYQFIVDTFFSALARECLKCGCEEIVRCEPDKLEVWRKCYRDVTSQPSVKAILFHSPSRDESYIGKFNTLAAVFLLLQARTELDGEFYDLAFQLGYKLVDQYFDKELQMMDTCPRLEEIVTSFVHVIEGNPGTLSKNDVAAYLENLLTFFFSPVSTELNENDVIWFLGYVNTFTSVDSFQMFTAVHQDVAGEEPPPVKDQSPLLNALSTAVAKQVLGEILTHPQGNEKTVSPLSIFYRKARRMVAQVLLQQDSLEGTVGHYLPLVYRQYPDINTGPPNPRMEQPLADVYFLVAMERIVGEKMAGMRLETALHVISIIRETLKRNPLDQEETVLLYIELQAAVQMVLWNAAQSVTDHELKMSALRLHSDINNLVMDPSTQGEKKDGHKLVFMMFLLKQLNGPTALLDFINSSITRDLPFLNVYKEEMTNSNEESVHFFPFMLPEAKGPLAEMYLKVTRLMVAAGTDEEDPQAKTALVDGLTEMARLTTVKGEEGNDVHTKLFLKMTVWLVVYYQFYSTGTKCPFLSDIIRNECQLLEFTEEQLQLIECFLHPDLMVKSAETSVPQGPALGHSRQSQLTVTEVPPDPIKDPIHALFNPPDESREDPSVVQLRHALANLIALTFSLPPRSTHLWYFLFNQSELEDTYLPGFMYPTEVAPNKLFYDCGVLLKDDGQFGRPDYRDHSSPLSLHSFYLIKWATFGVLCMALLTNQKAKEKIHGHIISDHQPLRHFCLDQLKQTWHFMRCNLQLGDEERSFLIVQAMQQLFERGQSELLPGKFVSLEAVEQYEQHWHSLYETSASGLGKKLQQQSQLLDLDVFKNLSIIGAMYPRFPTERQLRYSLESLLSSSEPSRPRHSILACFLDDRERLAVGSALLPDLVEMYLWLDMHLAHLLPYETAFKMSLKEVITKASKRFSSEAERIHKLYERLTINFNRYVRLNGGVIGIGGRLRHCHNELVTSITDRTPVIRLLTTDSSREGGKTGWLCLVMKDIISAHNNIVQLVASQGTAASFSCWLSAPLTIEVREFSIAEALYSNQPQLRSDERLQSMIRSRYLPMVPEDPSDPMVAVNPMRTRAVFDLGKLESDVVCCFIAGKPFINDVDTTFRRSFRFRDNKADLNTVATGLAGPGCPVDLAALSQELPESCKVELTEDRRKGLEANFHSASYNILSELVTGLRTAAGYLYQTLQREGPGVLEHTLTKFLCHYFGEEHPSSDLLKRIELHEFTPEQLCVLETLQVQYLFKTLEMFVGWISDCIHDFHELPFAVKRPLPTTVPGWFEAKVAEQSESASLRTLDDLEDKVSRIAQGLHKDSIKPSQPLRENLVATGLYSDRDAALQLVPKEVLLQHYMHFVVLLRKRKLQLQNSCSAHTDNTKLPQPKWKDMVPDVWEKLPHFQDKFTKILYSPEELTLDHRTMKFAYQMTDDERNLSRSQGYDRIWLDSEDSMESEQDVSMKATPSDSFVDISGEERDVTVLRATLGQTDEEDDQLPKNQHKTNAAQLDSFEDLIGESGSATDISAAVGQTEAEDNQPKKEQHSPLPTPMPSKQDSQPGPISMSPIPGQTSIEESTPLATREPSEKARAMTVEEVVQWLQEIKLSKYAEFFREEDVDGEMLAWYTLEDLEEIGVKRGVDRKKIHQHFRRI